MIERSVLKEGQVFLVCGADGNIAEPNHDGQGLYWRDTRFLSRFEVDIAGLDPGLLSSAGEHSFMTNLQLANAAFRTADGRDVAARTISIRRNRFIRGGLHERIGLFNYNPFPVTVAVTVALGSDFRDMFDVRGYASRTSHGRVEEPLIDGRRVILGYTGLDGLERRTIIEFDRDPTRAEITSDEASSGAAVTMGALSGQGDPRTERPVPHAIVRLAFEIRVLPGTFQSITVRVVPTLDRSPIDRSPIDRSPTDRDASPTLDTEFVAIRESYREWERASTSVSTDNELVSAVIDRALHDLRLLCEPFGDGYLPSAGIPWFAVPFGRDSLITALQTLWIQPGIARATLRFLAQYQGRELNDWRDEQPGKILHEVRMGELAALGEVPHAPYYGSVDATPLFVFALGEYARWTGDWALTDELRPNVEAALGWLEVYGDLDGDGYVEYLCRSQRGIRNQGWKDSRDAIVHRDGAVAEPPVALAEVQGYVYGAWLAAAAMFERWGADERGSMLRARAADLRRRFEREWWVEEAGCFAMALDAAKRPVESVSSNPLHCLWTGLLTPASAEAIANRALDDDMLSGWGLRTLGSREAGFNPMSYHRGSVWPHDNSIAVAGFARYGLMNQAVTVANQLFEAALRFPGFRLPELYCGFSRDRRYFSIPAQYPVSCSPQAWAAGAVFLMLQSLLRLAPGDGTLRVDPWLPDGVARLSVRRLRVGNGTVGFDVVPGRDRATVENVREDGVRLVR